MGLSSLFYKPLQLLLPYKRFYLLLQIVAVRGVMTVVTMETAVFISRPFDRVSFQLAQEGQGSFILDLHQDLINGGI